jgi:hypothetical protein
VGIYPITIAPGTLAAVNYTFTFINGTLTIVQATPVVTVSCPLGVVFDSNVHACTATAMGVAGAVVSGTFTITYNGNAVAPANAGTYAVNASFVSGDPNYSNASGTGLLVIVQATPLVTVSCPAVHFNHHRHACTATVAGVAGAPVIGTLTITYNGQLRPPFRAGTYAVVATFTSFDPNYTNATGMGTLVISRGHHDQDRDDRDDDDDGRRDDDSRDGDKRG